MKSFLPKPTFKVDDIISYAELVAAENANVQKGMNFQIKPEYSIFLMSVRKNAPYADEWDKATNTLIYEGHDAPQRGDGKNPKLLDQPMYNPSGSLTQNGQFFETAEQYKIGKANAEIVKVYEKLRSGIWVYNGVFRLLDAWLEVSDARSVFKFRLELTDGNKDGDSSINNITHNRIIPSSVKLEVWKRDKGKCTICGNAENIHFDHIIPFSKGGSSLVAANIQLLCAKHNLMKHDNIE